jgi:guanine nucleotide-binding protein subunit alpha, other
MGACLSSGGIEVTEEEKKLHREAEKQMKEVSPNTTPSFSS